MERAWGIVGPWLWMFGLGIAGVALTMLLLNTNATRFVPPPSEQPAVLVSPSPSPPVVLEITVSRDTQGDAVVTVEELAPPDAPTPNPDVPTSTPVVVAVRVAQEGEDPPVVTLATPAPRRSDARAADRGYGSGAPARRQAGYQACAQADHRHRYP